MAKDFYQTLGIGKNASADEIRRAYRKLAHEFHPDKQGGDAARFREVNEAYEVLSDDTKRAQYDRFGSGFENMGGFSAQGGPASGWDFSNFVHGFDFGGFSARGGSASGGDFSDIFSDIFGGGSRRSRRQEGIDLEMSLAIDFLDSVFGATKEIELEKRDACPVCRGSGAEPGSKIIICPKCHGQGQIVTHQKTILGSFQRAETCDHCQGTGKVPEKECRECRGLGFKKQHKTVKVIIPPGIDNGQRLRLSGEGEMGYRGSKPGDLYIVIQVKGHPEFKRAGFDILSEVPASFYQAAIGAEVEVNTVDGPVMLRVPAGAQSGKVLRLRGKGVPHLDSGGTSRGHSRGDHLITVRVITPQKLTKKEKDLLRALSEESGEAAQVDKTLWQKIKDSF